MVGGNLAGITRTVSISIFDDVQALDYSAAMHTSLLLLGDLLSGSGGHLRTAAEGLGRMADELAVDVRKRYAGGPEIAAALACAIARTWRHGFVRAIRGREDHRAPTDRRPGDARCRIHPVWR